METINYAGFVKIPNAYGNKEFINANNVASIRQPINSDTTVVTYINGEKDFFETSADEIATALNESKVYDNVNGTGINFIA